MSTFTIFSNEAWGDCIGCPQALPSLCFDARWCEGVKRQRESNQFLSGLTLPRASVSQKKVQQKAVRYEVPEVMIE